MDFVDHTLDQFDNDDSFRMEIMRAGADPIFTAYQLKIDLWRITESNYTIKTPDDLRAWQISHALNIAAADGKKVSVTHFNDKEQVHNPNGQMQHSTTLLNAPAYLWISAVMRELRTQAKSIKNVELTPEMVGDPIMWWCFQKRAHIGGGDSFSSILLQRLHNGLGVTIDSLAMDGRLTYQTGNTLWGTPAVGGPEGKVDILSMIIVMLTFLNSPYIPKEIRQVSRAARRRAPGVSYKPSVWVDLRAINGDGLSGPPGSGGREFSHRWLVRGHVREQWYPSEKKHHAIFIPPYVKGPDGKPLIIKPKRVIR